ncbi:MAG: DNA-binding protein [Desulfobulbaceae bacterium]|nr:DNA-binding protein [Desulfobulbaceae bacterium]HIJ79861.1 DNA-binding protein [Deltaproteobacteria bacterium]
MDYRTGSINRVFSLRFDEGDDFLGGMKDVITKEKIRCGWFQVIGGLREAEVVTGPQQPVMPPTPVWKTMSGAHETMGIGSIFWANDEPLIHLHAAMGHHGETLTACVRKGTKVYLILEVFIIEISEIDASRPWYDKGGFNRLTFAK